MNVVLPTAKPPATTILTGIGALTPGSTAASEGLKTIEHPFKEPEAGTVTTGVGPVECEQSVVGHVADENLGHANRHMHVRR